MEPIILPEIKEALNCMSKLRTSYMRKCEEVKQKSAIVTLLEKHIESSKTRLEKLRQENKRLCENLGQFKEITDIISTLEGEITKLQHDYRCLEKKIENQVKARELERESWLKKKRKMEEKNKGELEVLKKKNAEEVSALKNSLLIENMEIEKKASVLELELRQCSYESEELLIQTRRIGEEKLRKKDDELRMKQNELKYWRNRNSFERVSFEKLQEIN